MVRAEFSQAGPISLHMRATSMRCHLIEVPCLIMLINLKTIMNLCNFDVINEQLVIVLSVRSVYNAHLFTSLLKLCINILSLLNIRW